MTKFYRPAPPGYHYIFVKAYRHARSHKMIRAADYGKEAFAILVKD